MNQSVMWRMCDESICHVLDLSLSLYWSHKLVVIVYSVEPIRSHNGASTTMAHSLKVIRSHKNFIKKKKLKTSKAEEKR
jgi:hypothetical protein